MTWKEIITAPRMDTSHRIKPVERFIKRLTDVIISLFILLALLPVLAIIAVLICLDSPGPPIYRQKRVGQDGHFFQIYKFRTMHIGTPELPTHEMQLLPRPTTKFGQ